MGSKGRYGTVPEEMSQTPLALTNKKQGNLDPRETEKSREIHFLLNKIIGAPKKLGLDLELTIHVIKIKSIS
jgi:hypothetical protein